MFGQKYFIYFLKKITKIVKAPAHIIISPYVSPAEQYTKCYVYWNYGFLLEIVIQTIQSFHMHL